MMNDNEFAELEKVYLEEKQRRRELQNLINHKDELEGYLENLDNAKDNSFEHIGDMKLSCYISYSDCEGKREIDRDNIEIKLEYDQFVNIIKGEVDKTNKEIEAKKLQILK